MGHVAKDQGRMNEARDNYLKAIKQARAINATPTLLEILIGLAETEADDLQALHWLGLAQAHPATTDSVRTQIDSLLGTLSELLPAATVEAGLSQGSQMALDPIIDALALEYTDDA
jgi:hypothetical protein